MLPGITEKHDFERIYQQHLPEVFRYACRCVGRREVAEEMTAEAFLELYRRLDGLSEENLRGWLMTVVRNRATDYWRRAALESRYTAPLASPALANGPQQTLESWLADREALKPIHRVCVLLRYAWGMERGEIARRTGLSENQVKGSLQYALILLRKELEP
ncbi:MAG: sigma-70 family RNA polymerase sigma factor [Acidobacteria bacterium]|nr:sigma-70 family RNA polymerase sigma factor [Acidobacteriota bacterium]